MAKKMSPTNEGQMGVSGKGYSTTVGPAIPEEGELSDLQSLESAALDRAGFQTSGYQTKKGTPYGEAAKFNFLPPGQDISNQEVADIHEMKFMEIVDSQGFDGFYKS